MWLQKVCVTSNIKFLIMKKPQFPDVSIFMCNGSKCGKHKDFRKELKNEVKSKIKHLDVEFFKMECTDRCKFAPVLSLQPSNIWYCEADSDTIPKIIKQIKNSND